MARKNKPPKAGKPAPQTVKAGGGETADEPISVLGWRVIGAGAVCVVLGFLTLTRADALGRNWASTVSPLLILAGYALVGLGIFVPAPVEGGESSSSSPPAQP